MTKVALTVVDNGGATVDITRNLLQQIVSNIRPDLVENGYIKEALRVLPVGGNRSAIGAFWNAVIDDLRNKIIHRSLKLFNNVSNCKEVKKYDDFQDNITDEQLIEGAYKAGVIDYEAQKMLKRAKEVRHLFSGHPNSSEPSLIQVLGLFEDCIKYVLSVPYPPIAVDIEVYIEGLKEASFDRNEIAVAETMGSLPEIYRDQLAHRLFDLYVHKDTPSTMRSNIAFVAPVLWKCLPKPLKIQIAARVTSVLQQGNQISSTRALDLMVVVGSSQYLSETAKKYATKPLIDALESSLGDWDKEGSCVKNLSPYATLIPRDYIARYVPSLMLSFVGWNGYSAQYSRTDFYSDVAAQYIPDMVKAFDDAHASVFIDSIKTNESLRYRIRTAAKLNRLRQIAEIVLDRTSIAFPDRSFLEALVDPSREGEFFELLPAIKK